ncbi:MAG: ubiquinone/menaquinone biosynthesis methyltransferase [Candidatus Omnitrophica bacterium]|nr:ubiquinone/menaquinone biosynthesis methyltransferase [Candidatus Omnitrophota bacterium]
MSSIKTIASPEKELIRQYFDGIAHRYDFLNNFLSFNLDEHWRRKSLKIILEGDEKSILDLGTGTGKFLKLFLKSKTWEKVVAVDFSTEMLKHAQKELPHNVSFVAADFHDLPFPDKSFDLITSSFTLRSVKDMDRFLSEVFRILGENGKAAFLCLTRPTNFFFKILYYPYLNIYLPIVGCFFSGHKRAYEFLSQSIQHFQSPEKTMEAMIRAGFKSVRVHRFTFGTATLIIGKK